MSAHLFSPFRYHVLVAWAHPGQHPTSVRWARMLSAASNGAAPGGSGAGPPTLTLNKVAARTVASRLGVVLLSMVLTPAKAGRALVQVQCYR
jgi:hypothetical protein